MKKILIAAALLLAPSAVSAEHMDVIGFKLKDSCSFSTYMGIVTDFNKWGVKYGYKAQALMPLQGDNLVIHYWVGTSKNAAAFGAAWDAWRDAQSDPNSVAAKLQSRFDDCSLNVTRNSYDAY